MENDAWRLYRPVFTVDYVAAIARSGAFLGERTRFVEMDHRELHTGPAVRALANRSTFTAVWADPNFVQCNSERYCSYPSIN